MRYTVHGVRTQAVSIEVEADSSEEALAKANEGDFSSCVDVWDSEYMFHFTG